MKATLLALALFLFPPAINAQEDAGSSSQPAISTETVSTRAQELRLVGDLQTMGIPANLSYYDQPDEKRAALYEHTPTSPTVMGTYLHQVLGRLNQRQRAQLQFSLARNDYARLGEALRMLEKAVALYESGHAEAYDDLVQGYLDRALEILTPKESEPALDQADTNLQDVREVLGKHREELQTRRKLLQGVQNTLPLLFGPNSQAMATVSTLSQQETKRIDEAISSIEVITGEKESGHLTHQSLLTLVRTLPQSQLNEAQWKAVTSSFPMGESLNRMEVLKLWRAGITGKGVRVAVVDDGADSLHPELQGVSVAANFTHERHLNGPQVGQPDNRGMHGTHVSGIIRALAPEAEIRVYKGLESESENIPPQLQLNSLQMAQAVNHAMQTAADDGNTVMNLSLGWESGHQIAPDLLADKAQELREEVSVVVAAGNEGRGSGRTPGLSDAVLTVGALTYTDRQASFSSRNDVVRIGEDKKMEVRTKPDTMAYGAGVNSSLMDWRGKYDDPKKNYGRFNGTSMAAPHVTAVIALMQQRAKELGLKLTPEEERAIIRGTGTLPREGPHGVTALDPNAAIRGVEELARTRLAPPAAAVAMAASRS